MCDLESAPRPTAFGFGAWRFRFPLTDPFPFPPQFTFNNDSVESERHQELTRTSAEAYRPMVMRKEEVRLDTIDLCIIHWTPECDSGTHEHLSICSAMRIGKSARTVV